MPPSPGPDVVRMLGMGSPFQPPLPPNTGRRKNVEIMVSHHLSLILDPSQSNQPCHHYKKIFFKRFFLLSSVAFSGVLAGSRIGPDWHPHGWDFSIAGGGPTCCATLETVQTVA